MSYVPWDLEMIAYEVQAIVDGEWMPDSGDALGLYAHIIGSQREIVRLNAIIRRINVGVATGTLTP